MNRSSSTGPGMLGLLFKAVLGAGAVIAGAYVTSKLQARQRLERRLENLEQMIATLSDEEAT
jgi:hypothetical protein